MTELSMTQFVVLSLLSYPIQLCRNILMLCPDDRGYPLHLHKLGRVKNRAHTLHHLVTTESLRKRVDGSETGDRWAPG